MTRVRDTLRRLLVMPILVGCAAGTPPATAAVPAEPDCSFRSASTCWTLKARFPRARREAPDSAGRELREPPARVLASRADRT